jgi:hypothetical protein
MGTERLHLQPFSFRIVTISISSRILLLNTINQLTITISATFQSRLISTQPPPGVFMHSIAANIFFDLRIHLFIPVGQFELPAVLLRCFFDSKLPPGKISNPYTKFLMRVSLLTAIVQNVEHARPAVCLELYALPS